LAKTVRPLFPEVSGDEAEVGEDVIGLFSRFFIAGKERAGVLQLGDEESAALFLAPGAEGFSIGNSNRGKEFGGCGIV
jgi:hypothetical protein